MVSAGTEGLVSIKLPDEYWKYEYRLVETKAPGGYSRARVGTILFTLSEDGTVKDISNNDGTWGYVDVSADRTTIIAKNHTTGGGGGGGGGTDPTTPAPTDPPGPTDPTTPTETTIPMTTEPGVVPLPPGVDPNNPGDLPPGRYLVTIIGEDGVPLSYILEVPVPQGSLVKTGDEGTAVWMLIVMMAAAAGMFGVILCVRGRKESDE